MPSPDYLDRRNPEYKCKCVSLPCIAFICNGLWLGSELQLYLYHYHFSMTEEHCIHLLWMMDWQWIVIVLLPFEYDWSNAMESKCHLSLVYIYIDMYPFVSERDINKIWKHGAIRKCEQLPFRDRTNVSVPLSICIPIGCSHLLTMWGPAVLFPSIHPGVWAPSGFIYIYIWLYIYRLNIYIYLSIFLLHIDYLHYMSIYLISYYMKYMNILIINIYIYSTYLSNLIQKGRF